MQTIKRSVEYTNTIGDVTKSNYTIMVRCYTRDNVPFMLLQALHVEIEMKNLSLQVTLLVQKGAGTRSHPTTPRSQVLKNVRIASI